MFARNTTIALAGAALISACSGASPYQKSSGSYHSTTSGESAGDSDGAPGSADSHGGAPAPSQPSSAYRQPTHEPSRVVRPRERPGLGTVWGETRYSRVQQRTFYRNTSSPFAAVALHYNDAGGVNAHANYRGGARPLPIRAYTPHRGISVSLVDEYGRILPGVTAGGKTLVVGQHGHRYNIVVQNHTGGRFEVVASVDGLDVIDGRKADVRKRGYIIEPYGRLTIDGFRRSETHVAAFRFGRVSNSYAARTSGARNVGVIGVALYAERGSEWTTDELRTRDTANPFPGDHQYARPPSY